MILCNSSGGLYDFRNELVLAMLKEHRVIVCAPDEVKTELLKNEGCEIVYTAINRRGINPVQDLALFRQYMQLFKKYKPDAVLTYTIKPNIYGGIACRLSHTAYFTNITGLGTVFERGGLLQKMVVILYRFALKKSCCVFFQNAENKDKLEKLGIHGRKARLIPGSGVNLEKYTFESYPDTDETHFLVMSRIMKEKGFDEYLACAEAFHSEKVHFHIIGYHDEEAYKDIIEKMNREGVIHYHGFQENVREYLTNASCIVVLSYHEGMSNVILEAAATGRPAIVSRIHGCIEAVEDNVTGLICEVQNTDSAKEAVGRFIQMNREERAKMGRAAREKMEREFDRQIVVNTYLEEIKECV